MQLIENIDEFPKEVSSVATIGIFDGVHLGHVKVLNQLVDEAKKHHLKSVVVTFWPHPRIILNNDSQFKLINSLNEKLLLLAENQIDYVCVLPFSIDFSKTSPQDFIENYLKQKLQVKKLVLGYDHKFGKDKEGSFEYLKENQQSFGLEVVEISQKDVDFAAVSSTRIRETLQNGEIKLANTLLGYSYSITGTVKHGNKLGRTIGFPTANIGNISTSKILPQLGVYFVQVLVGEELFFGMLNIGYKPTVGNFELGIEVHIFDFDRDIYGNSITVKFLDKIREEKKFKGLSELLAQLQSDKKYCEDLIKKM